MSKTQSPSIVKKNVSKYSPLLLLKTKCVKIYSPLLLFKKNVKIHSSLLLLERNVSKKHSSLLLSKNVSKYTAPFYCFTPARKTTLNSASKQIQNENQDPESIPPSHANSSLASTQSLMYGNSAILMTEVRGIMHSGMSCEQM